MDKILELFGKYRCHLECGPQSMADFLDNNFREYINDVRQSVEVKDNLLVGSEMCEMIADCIDEISENALSIINVLRLYGSGKIKEAESKAFDVFNAMKPQLLQRYSKALVKDAYYRIRTIKEPQFPLERKELFHVPYDANSLISAGRYSMSGHPCLYLSSQAELAWYECGKPEKFAIAKFKIPQEEDDYLKLIDFSEKLMMLKHNFYIWFHDEDDKETLRKYLLKHIYTYPLRAACSVAVENHREKSNEEYIIPRLLLRWICNDEDFDGIRYESCSSCDEVKTYSGYNIALLTKRFDGDGYDVKLRNCVKIGKPVIIDVEELKSNAHLQNSKNGIDIIRFPYLYSIPDDYQTL